MSDQEDIADGTKGTCPVCGRVLGIITPSGGDGSLKVMLWHKTRLRTKDDDRWSPPRCPGTRRPAKEWA